MLLGSLMEILIVSNLLDLRIAILGISIAMFAPIALLDISGVLPAVFLSILETQEVQVAQVAQVAQVVQVVLVAQEALEVQVQVGKVDLQVQVDQVDLVVLLEHRQPQLQ